MAKTERDEADKAAALKFVEKTYADRKEAIMLMRRWLVGNGPNALSEARLDNGMLILNCPSFISWMVEQASLMYGHVVDCKPKEHIPTRTWEVVLLRLEDGRCLGEHDDFRKWAKTYDGYL